MKKKIAVKRDCLFEVPEPNYKLREGDRMRRTNPESASSLNWFPVAEFDYGQKASYFNNSGFIVEKRKPSPKRRRPPLIIHAVVIQLSTGQERFIDFFREPHDATDLANQLGARRETEGFDGYNHAVKKISVK